MSPTARELFSTQICYKISAASFIDPAFLTPSATSRFLGARAQTIDSVLFPSAKALLFEQYSWHSVFDRNLEGLDVASITPPGRRYGASTFFFDGSAVILKPQDVKPWISLSPWPGGPLAQTLDGVRGRDR
ncbi:MAG: hypothetical protein ACREJD_11770 [Phycisphaerales bacterium]